MTVALPATRRGAEVARGRDKVRTRAGRLPKLVLIAWAALLFNVLTRAGDGTIIPIPPAISSAMAQGSLLVALLFALLANPRLVMRPTLFLVLLTVMAVVAFVVSLHSDFIAGSTFRGARLLGFIACLWLLTPWWGRDDLLLLRCHWACLWAIIASVVVGAALGPGKAFANDGRLGGTLWPIWPTQVAHYSAVLLGLTAILWMCRVITGRHALLAALVTAAVLLETHTRTALLALVVGLVLASASLFVGHARVRRASVTAVVVGLGVGVSVAPQVLSWLMRGQSAQQASALTGRAEVWSSVSQLTRPLVKDVFGDGLSNKSFNGASIDSSWVSTFLDLGWFGIALEVSFLLVLVLMVVTRARGPRRALALFLLAYCVVSSFTETGLGDASAYLLDLVVAASLLVTPPRLPA
ncbi:hypothetical protein [Terrabacter sp. NPDC080008]|uniref:hypothetical protein n=1 Tax=Terrabacter sp. NPDC080008 TaxID=3155176 RepID=UPI00344CB82F